MFLVLLQVELPPTNLPFLFAAFAVTWVVFFVYAFFVSRHRQELQREIGELRQVLEQSDAPDED